MKIFYISSLKNSVKIKIIAATLFCTLMLVFLTPTSDVIIQSMELRTGGDGGGSGGVDLRQIQVSNAEDLLDALDVAKPGDIISLADGHYTGVFVVTRSGTAEKKITLEGSSAVIFENPNREENNNEIGHGLQVKADHWVIRGFTIVNSMKGVMVDGGNYNLLQNLTILHMDDEGIHFRFGSSYNVVQGCFFNDTGIVREGYGEGVYIGQVHSKWEDGKPDECIGNEVIENVFGDAVRGENIDVKEGTCCGRIAGNFFNGRGLTNQHFDDNWVDMKGDMYVIEDNVGQYSPKEGFGISSQKPFGRERLFQSACGNVFQRNRCDFQQENKGNPCVACNNGCPCYNIVQDNIQFVLDSENSN